MLNYTKIIIAFFLFIVVSITACNENQRYSPDGYISLKLTEPNVSLPEELEVLRQADPSRICLFTMGDTSKGTDFIFSIGRLTTGDSTTIRKAFDKGVRPVLPPVTMLVSADIYEKNGKMYYRKLTESTDLVDTVRSTMFYVMDNGLSHLIYELKATSNTHRAEIVMARMEEMAGSVEFNHD